ncbi:MAG: RagB/SusD protein [Segetibacter sp.]|nr:RagB/SusD protein [Segetibacter sp.]
MISFYCFKNICHSIIKPLRFMYCKFKSIIIGLPGFSLNKTTACTISTISVISSCLFFMIITGCKKFVTVDTPSSQLNSLTVFGDDRTATAAMFNVYIQMSKTESYTVPFYTGLSSDELNFYGNDPTAVEFNSNSLFITNVAVLQMWNSAFNYIYQANAVIEGLAKSKEVSLPVKQQLGGEAKFIRAFWNFYLVNMFGDVPSIVTTDYRTNSRLSRISVSKIFDQIITDLNEALTSLSDYYPSDNNGPDVERVRPNKSVARALLSRVYLYAKDWSNAEDQASSLINDPNYFLIQNLDSVFLKGSPEAIWQLMAVDPTYNTIEANQFIPSGPPEMSLTSDFINYFEADDMRKISWINSLQVDTVTYYYPFKYKIKSIDPGTSHDEYSIVFRLAEQYLIRAEARLEQNNLQGALDDLNTIRHRAGLFDFISSDKAFIADAIARERRVELFCEWYQRWFDLKRTVTASRFLQPLKQSNWQETDVLYPIPEQEIQKNPNLTQNPGY